MISESQMEIAQIQIESAKSQLNTAQIQLQKARQQVDSAKKHLETATAQKYTINAPSVEAAKSVLEIADKRFSAAVNQLNAITSNFDAAKIQLDLVSLLVTDEKSKLQTTITNLQNENSRINSKLQETKSEVQKLILEKSKSHNRKVFLEISTNGRRAGRIVIELDYKTTPRTSENFRALCTGEAGIGQLGKPLHYKGSKFYRKLPEENGIQGGDITRDDGLGGDSIYGPTFRAENHINKHNGPGVVSMAHDIPSNNPQICNGSRFLISTAKFEACDGTNVVFGHVVEGMDIVMDMHRIGSGANFVIFDCGEIRL